jgi:CheY-like chemotaxis protein
MRAILESRGHEVVEAGDGRAAIDLIGGDEQPDLLVTDLSMSGMNGLELIASVRRDSTNAGIRILVVSGEEERSSALESVLGKPFTALQLITKVESLVDADEKARWLDSA